MVLMTTLRARRAWIFKEHDPGIDAMPRGVVYRAGEKVVLAERFLMWGMAMEADHDRSARYHHKHAHR
jgi:hypothetical protein